MRTIILAAAIMAGCTTTPYDDLAYQVQHDVKWIDQSDKPDRYVYGCRPEGDCDDRALCAACRLVQAGASPASITVVVQGWPGTNPANHMSLEYNGYCLLGYASTAYEGKCTHLFEDSEMATFRLPLSEYIKRTHPIMECPGNGI